MRVQSTTPLANGNNIGRVACHVGLDIIYVLYSVIRFTEVQIKEQVSKMDRQVKEGTFDPEEPNLIKELQASPRSTPETVSGILLDLQTAGTDSVGCCLFIFVNLCLLQ